MEKFKAKSELPQIDCYSLHEINFKVEFKRKLVENAIYHIYSASEACKVA